jgi:acetyltransferase-like isoleucine patch superfamily enzyme
MLDILLFFMPSCIHVFIRRLRGQTVARSAKIKLGSFIRADDLTLGKHVTIGPGVILSANKIQIGDFSSVRGPTVMSCKQITLGSNARVSSFVIVRSDKLESARFSMGHCSSVFPLCWIEPGEGVTIDDQAGVGGYSLIFTHGVWPSYLEGGPVQRGPVYIGKNVWLPWRVFVLPGVTIGKNCVIGAGAVVNKSIPDNAFATGMPAKVIRSPAYESLDINEKRKRVCLILEKFARATGGTYDNGEVESDGKIFKLSEANNFEKLEIRADDLVIDLANYTVSKNGLQRAEPLTGFLRDYGIRLRPE